MMCSASVEPTAAEVAAAAADSTSAAMSTHNKHANVTSNKNSRDLQSFKILFEFESDTTH